MKVRWDKGGEADIVTITMDTIALVSTTPSPPGSRIEGELAAPLPGKGGATKFEADGSGARIRVKVHGCKREADGRYRIDGRPLDLTRLLHDRLQSRA